MNTNTQVKFTDISAPEQPRLPHREWPPPAPPNGLSRRRS